MTALRELPTGTVTFLFTDIEGSTRLSQEFGEVFAALIDRHHELMREALAAHDGMVVSTEGDAFFAVFSDVGDAVRATIAAQRALESEPWPEGGAVRVRMGLHTGVGRLGGDNYAGIDVNRASRISDAAHGGQILLSRASVEGLGNDLPEQARALDLGEVLLKGIAEPEPVFQLEVDGLPSAFPAPRAERPGWLPEAITSFVGRDAELDELLGHLEVDRLVTLTGPGGTGKTRLSIEAARAAQSRFAGGCWFVALADIEDAGLAIPQIADRLGLSEEPGRSLADTISDRIGSKRTLVVLDNLEQIVAFGPDLHELLSRTPGLHVLASSREALRISGELEYAVPVLDAEMGATLFIERGRKVRPGLGSDPDDRPSIDAIVTRLDGLPLAIELAAARVRMFAPAALLRRLEGGLSALGQGNRELPERQRTLRGAIEWSHGLLEPDERSLFASLAVFRGGVGLDAAEVVLTADDGAGADVTDGIMSLVDKSLLSVRDGPDGEPRVGMLQSIGAYATERLDAEPRATALRERHAHQYMAFAEEMQTGLAGETPDDALERLDIDHDNLRAALDWSMAHDLSVGLRIGAAIWRFWQQRAHLAEGRQRLTALLDHPKAAADQCASAGARTALGGIVFRQNELDEARAIYERALEGYRACGDRAGEAHALSDLMFPAAVLGDVESAIRLGDESMAIHRELGNQDGMALVLHAQTIVAVVSGDYEHARTTQEEAVAIRRSQSSRYWRADSIGTLAIVEALLGDGVAARRHLDEWYDLNIALGPSGSGGFLQAAALVALLEDDPATAALLAGCLQTIRDADPSIPTASGFLRFEDPAETAQRRLGDAFDQHFEEGRSLTLDEALARAFAASRKNNQPSSADGHDD